MSSEFLSLLRSGELNWHQMEEAETNEIESLVAATRGVLPELLIDWLRFSNGGEGSLDLAPECFVLDSAQEIARSYTSELETNEFPGLTFFGGNGGLERIAFDTRSGAAPWPTVAVDPIAGMSSLQRIADNFEHFVLAVGRKE